MPVNKVSFGRQPRARSGDALQKRGRIQSRQYIGPGCPAPVFKFVATNFRMRRQDRYGPEIEAPYVATNADIPFRMKHGVDAKTR
jgi:hypothetical protein